MSPASTTRPASGTTSASSRPTTSRGRLTPSTRRSSVCKSVFILNDKEAYGQGVATDFKNAATKLGIKVAGFTAWDGKASSYEALAVKIKSSGAKAVFLGGLVCENGGKLIKDIAPGDPASRSWLLTASPRSPLIVQGAGAAAEGMIVSVAGLPNAQLKGAGKAFVAAFTKFDHKAPDPYAVYAAQAADVLIAGDRDVRRHARVA